MDEIPSHWAGNHFDRVTRKIAHLHRVFSENHIPSQTQPSQHIGLDPRNYVSCSPSELSTDISHMKLDTTPTQWVGSHMYKPLWRGKQSGTPASSCTRACTGEVIVRIVAVDLHVRLIGQFKFLGKLLVYVQDREHNGSSRNIGWKLNS